MNFGAANEYESALISSVLWASSGRVEWLDELRNVGLRPEDMGDDSARIALKGLYALADAGKSLDLPTMDLVDWVARHEDGAGEWFTVTYVMDRFSTDYALPSQVLLAGPAVAVMEAARARRELGRSRGLAMAGDDPGTTPDEFLRLAAEMEAERDRESVGEEAGPRPLKEIGKEAMAWILERAKGELPAGIVPTGYRDLDRMMGGGPEPGEVVVLAARPSVGKTAFALNLVRNAALEMEAACLFFSLEMPSKMLWMRLVAMDAGVSLTALRASLLPLADWERCKESWRVLHRLDLEIDDTGGLALVSLVARARNWARKRKGKRKLIAIDYVQLVKADVGKNGNREQEVSTVSQGVKALAKACGCPILLLAQLNREADKGKRPQMGHLRESGSLEQDADVVAILHRDKDDTSKPTEVIVAKNRNGAIGTVNTRFSVESGRFESMGRVADEDVPVPDDGYGASSKRAPGWMERRRKEDEI